MWQNIHMTATTKKHLSQYNAKMHESRAPGHPGD